MLRLGNLSITKVYIGSTPAPKGFLGEVQIWGQSTPVTNKARLVLSDSTVVEIPFTGDSDVTITSAEIDAYRNSLVSAEVYSGVTTIGDNTFGNCESLTSVTLPNSVTTIGDVAFGSCSSLESITLPNTVTTIGNSAFTHCGYLESITLPNSVTTMGSFVFEGCSSLTTATLPSGLTEVPVMTFYGCSSLTSVTFPSSVTGIGFMAFRECYSMTSIVIPNTVTYIGEAAFKYCNSLTAITCEATTPPTLDNSNWGYAFDDTNDAPIFVPCDSVDAYKSAEGWSTYEARITCLAPYGYKAKLTDVNGDVGFIAKTGETDTTITKTDVGSPEFVKKVVIYEGVTEIGRDTFFRGDYLESVVLPDSLITIRESAFGHCRYLGSIIIPRNVSSIGSLAFDNCPLGEVIVEGTSPAFLDAFAFDNELTINYPIYVPCSALNDYKTADYWRFYKDHIDCREYKGKLILNDDSKILIIKGDETDVTITESDIDYYKDSCLSAEIYSNVTSIGDSAFKDCVNLSSVTIPNSITSIGEQAFSRCSKLTGVSIPDTVASIGNNCFAQSIISSLDFERRTPATLGNDVFNSCVKTDGTPTPIYVPCSSIDAYKTAWSDYASRIQCIPFKAKLTYSYYDQGAQEEKTLADRIPLNGSSVLTAAEVDASMERVKVRQEYVALQGFEIDSSVDAFGEGVFRADGRLADVYLQWWIMPSVTGMGNYAFANNAFPTHFDDVTGEETGTEIDLSAVGSLGVGVFSGCSGIGNIIWNSNATAVPAYTCSMVNQGYPSLYNLSFAGTNIANIGAYAFAGRYNEEAAYDERSGLNGININGSVTTIGEGAFSYVENFNKDWTPNTITIGATVTNIGANAFKKTLAVGIYINSSTPATLGTGAFDDCGTTEWDEEAQQDRFVPAPIYVPAASVDAYKTAWSTYASRIQAIP